MRKILALAILMIALTSSVSSATDAAAREGAELPRRPSPVAKASSGINRRYGPFRVIDEQSAELDGVTDGQSPANFVWMTAEFPQLRVLRMADCPGTIDDVANLRLGRLIHSRGMATIVPASGSVRSGAVEIFIAGVRRTVEPGAQFAVHTWSDLRGIEVADLGASDPISQTYLAYYKEMGLSDRQALGFYNLTNSIQNKRALWLTANDMARYVTFDQRF